MEQKSDKKEKQMNPDVNIASPSDPGQGNKDISRLSLNRQQGKDSASTSTKKRTPQCTCCKKYHVGECRKLTGGCYRCGDLGHHIKGCPKSSQGKRAVPGPIPTIQKPQKPRCPHCRKYHSGECRKLTGACYRCGDMGHKISDCRGQNKPKNTSLGPKKSVKE